MENRRPNAVERRLTQIRDAGIKVTTLVGNLETTASKYMNEITEDINYRIGSLGLLKNPGIFRLSDNCTEFISGEEMILYNVQFGITPELQSALDYGFTNRIIKGNDNSYLEVHAIYELNLNATHYFVLPSRRYYMQEEEKPKEHQ